MRQGAIVLLGLLITLPLAMPGAIAQEAPGTGPPDDWEPWLDEDLITRVPLEVTTGQHYPPDWDGPRLIAYELDVNQVLADAGWPTDRGQPVDFTLDPDSIRVVPQGVADPQPVPMVTWQGSLLTEGALGPTVTIAFLAEPGLDAYHVYFDRTEDGDEHEPVARDAVEEQRILQLLAGHGSGHELVAPLATEEEATVAITSEHATPLQVEHVTPQGSSIVSCSSTHVGPGTWSECEIGTGGDVHAVRVTAEAPVTAYAWTGSPDSGTEHAMVPLSGSQGTPNGAILHAPALRSGTTPVNLISVQGTCEATVGSTTLQVGPDTPTSVSIQDHETVDAECPLLGWIPGRGPATPPVSVNQTLTKSAVTSTGHAPGSCGIQQTVAAVGDRHANVVRVDTSVQEEDVRSLSRPTDAVPHRLDHEQMRAADWPALEDAQGTGYTVLNQGDTAWPSLWDPEEGAFQLAPTRTGSIGWIGAANAEECDVELRLAAVPFSGNPRVEFAAHGERLPPDVMGPFTVSQAFTHQEEPNDPTEIPDTGSLVETGLRGDVALTAGFALVGDQAIPTAFASHLRPMTVDEGQADVIGPLFDLQLEPTARISPPGEVQTFTLTGQGQHLAPTGEVTPLEVNLNAESITQTEGVPDVEHDLGTIQAQLPLDEPGEVTTLTVTAPNDVPHDTTPTYELLITGEPVDGGDAVPARATLQVVPDRELSLTFSDGSQLQDLTTEDGEASASLVLSNEGTAVEDVDLSTVVPGDLAWEVDVRDPSTGEPFPNDVVTELPPGEEQQLDLEVTVPGEASRVVDVTVVAQSLEDASVTSEATARVAHGIDVNVDGLVDPDLITLRPGSSEQANLTLENRGSEVSVQVSPEAEGALVVEAADDRVNLGPEGTPRANATVPLNVTAASDAPIGAVVVATITLNVHVGDLDPIEQLLSLRLRVVPDHGLTAVEPIEVLPGLKEPTNVTVRATGDADERVDLSLLSAPRGWTIEHPANVTVPHNTTAPVELNITTPEATEPGTYDVGFRGLPGDGTEPFSFRTQVIVPETPAFELRLPSPPPLGVGAEETFPMTIRNVGNVPGNATIETNASIVDAVPRPATPSQLAPGHEERLQLVLRAQSPGNDTVQFDLTPGQDATLPVDVGLVDLSLELVSVTPNPPSEGEPVQAVVSLSNEGTVQARNVNVSVMSGTQALHTENVARLDPGSQVSMTLAMNELPTTQGLSVHADPDGVYDQEDPTSREAALSPDEAPSLPLALVVLTGTLAAILRRT